MNKNIIEIFRFGIVGIIATVLHYGIYYLLNSIIPLNIAFTIGYGSGFIFNFFASTYFTFKTKATTKKGVGFIISNFINYLTQLLLLNFFLHINISKDIAPLFVFIIVIPFNFLLVRYILKHPRL